jgi:hypothetical protein
MKLFKQTAMILAAAALLGASAQADVGKGQKLYQKKLQKLCGTTGAVFASAHSQGEWEEAMESGTLGEVMIEVCPEGETFFKSDKFESKFKQHLFDFVYEYANDSGNVPAC